MSEPSGYSASGFANIRYVTSWWNWSFTVTDNLATPGPNTIHVPGNCPAGIDASAKPNKPFYLYIPTTNAEAALVTGGTCTPGAVSNGSLTLTVITAVAHSPNGNTVQSAYSGIQEALNDAGSPGAGVVIPATGANANALPVYATIYFQNSKSWLRGEGKPTILCHTRSVCLFMGDRANVNAFNAEHLSGIRFAAGQTFDGFRITQTACSSNTATITFANTGQSAIATGDFVDINWTFHQQYIGIHQVLSASPTQITYADKKCGGSGAIPSQPSAGFISLENAAVEDNTSEASMTDIFLDDKSSWRSWGLWQNGIVVDNDQAFKLDRLEVSEGTHSTANYVGQVIYFPGPFSTNAAVAWLSNLNLSLQCTSNGVTNWAGNTMHVSDSVIQGFSQWGVYTGVLRGGYGPSTFDDVYEEVGSCANPLYPGSGLQARAQSGLLNSGGAVGIHGGEFPIGQIPEFAHTGNAGTRYNYCFVVHDTKAGVSKCLPFGYANVDSASPSGRIAVSWPRIPGIGTVSYDILRYPGIGSSEVAPYDGGCTGGSTSACGSVATAIPQCSTTLCSFSDEANANTTRYAVSSPTELPGVAWLPGGLVSITSHDTANMGAGGVYLDDFSAITNVSPFISEGSFNAPQFYAHRCGAGLSGEWASCLAGSPIDGSTDPPAALLQTQMANSGGHADLKGRLNFLQSTGAGTVNGEIITLVDSNPGKTLATPGYRPKQDAADTYIGLDNRGGGAAPNAAALAIGAPVSISQYIHSAPDSTSYKERLTATTKIFAVPVQMTRIRFSTLPACGEETEGEMAAVTDSTTNAWGATITGSGTKHVLAYCDGTHWTVAAP
jgi:hypothetical protein